MVNNNEYSIKDIKKLYNNLGIEGMINQAEFLGMDKKEHIKKECDFILESVDKDKPNLLEIGFGYGRLTKFLVEKSNYTGIDIVDEYYNYCLDKYPKGKFLLKDFFKWDISKEKSKYDVIVFSWTILNHFNFDIQKKGFLKSLDLISNNGVIIIHWRDIEFLLKNKKVYKNNIEETEEGYELIIGNSITKNNKFFFVRYDFWRNQAKLYNMDIEFKKISEGEYFIIFKNKKNN